MRIKVVVQTCPQRRELLPQTLESIQGSDIDDYEVMEHPEGMSLYDFFLSVMRCLRDSGADYGVRLEDDALVNRHFIHNIRTWGALNEANFGAGWLFASQGMFNDRGKLQRSMPSGELYRNTREIHCALAVLLPIPLLRDELYAHMVAKGKQPQDFAMSGAVWDGGRRCYLHSPPIAENVFAPSVRGHTNHTRYGHCAGSYFKPDFKR